MKPVIKKQTHYSMLLMRDDSEVRTFRVKGGTIRLFLIFLFLLIAGGGVGIAAGIHYWKKYTTVAERQTVQERELSETRMQLERLVNLETLIVATNSTVPMAKNEEIGAAATPPRLQNATQKGTLNATRPVLVSAPASNSTGIINALKANATTPVSDPAPEQTNTPPLISSESSPLRITDFTARIATQQRLRIRYELSTATQEQKTISGVSRYAAVLSNGTRVDMILQDAGEARFAISRRKVMEATGKLPQGHNARDIVAVEISVDIEDGTTFYDRYTVTR